MKRIEMTATVETAVNAECIEFGVSFHRGEVSRFTLRFDKAVGRTNVCHLKAGEPGFEKLNKLDWEKVIGDALAAQYPGASLVSIAEEVAAEKAAKEAEPKGGVIGEEE